MKVLFIGGGTLGSVTPLLAVAEELRHEFEISPPKADAPREQNLKSEIRFWGTRRGPERAVVEAVGIPFTPIPAGKLRRYWDIRNILDPFVVLAALAIAFVRLLRERPEVVVGAGGFVQVPVCWAAWVLGIPVVLLQLDVEPGLANRLCVPCAAAIAAGLPESAERLRRPAMVTGVPVRGAIVAHPELRAAAIARFGLTPGLPTVLVMGGGTGAAALNRLVADACDALLVAANIVHLTGEGKGGSDARGGPGSRGVYRAFAFLRDEMPLAYAAADLVIARAGMGTIAELAHLGKHAVLMPMPGTHQEANAAALAARGAALVWNERELTADAFVARVRAALAAESTEPRAAIAACLPRDARQHAAAIIRSYAIPTGTSAP